MNEKRRWIPVTAGVTNLAHMEGKPLALGNANNVGFDAAEFTPNVAIIMGDNSVDGSNDVNDTIGGNEYGQGVYLLNNNATIADFPDFSRTTGGAPFSQWGITDTAGVTPKAGVEVALALANLGIEPGGTIKAAGILFCGASGANRWIAKEAYGKSMTGGDSSNPFTIIGSEIQLAAGDYTLPPNSYPGFSENDVMFQAFHWNADSANKDPRNKGTGLWYSVHIQPKVGDLLNSRHSGGWICGGREGGS